MIYFLHLDACIYPNNRPEPITGSKKRYWYHRKKLIICISLLTGFVLMAITVSAIFGSRSTIHSTGMLYKRRHSNAISTMRDIFDS